MSQIELDDEIIQFKKIVADLEKENEAVEKKKQELLRILAEKKAKLGLK